MPAIRDLVQCRSRGWFTCRYGPRNSHARENLAALWDSVEENREVVIVERQGHRSVALIDAKTKDEMEKETALAILRTHRADLQRLGVKSIALFGSVARDEATPDSDVDVLVDLGASPTFDQYMTVLEFLEDRLGTNVDLVTSGGLRPRVRPYVEREMIRVA